MPDQFCTTHRSLFSGRFVLTPAALPIPVPVLLRPLFSSVLVSAGPVSTVALLCGFTDALYTPSIPSSPPHSKIPLWT